MKKIVFLVLSVFAILQANAVVVQKVYLKNGSVLNGYIQKQDKNDNITFRSESAIICVSGKNATTTEHPYKIEKLDKRWIEWAEKNDAFIGGTGEDRKLVLNEVLFNTNQSNNDDVSDSMSYEVDNGSTFSNEFRLGYRSVSMVKVLEKGIYIKYLELTPNTYSFSWEDVESITAERRPKTALSGVNRVYQLRDGREVTGQYAGESYTTLSLYTASGMIETFDIEDVTKYFYKAINPNQDILEQSELIDVVRTKKEGVYRGVITERNFANGSNYLLIQLQTGSSRMLYFTDIVEYSKEENASYNPKYDILLKKGEVVINRVATDSVCVKRSGSNLVLDSINHKVVIPKEGNTTKVIVEYNNPEHLSTDNLILIKIDKNIIKKKPVYSFSTDIFIMKKFPAKRSETSVNNTTLVEYEIEGQGVFALYDEKTMRAMPFIVK